MAPIDHLLETFRRNSHPVVLVERHALSWCGANVPSTFNRINILIRKRDIQNIYEDLLETEDWEEIEYFDDIDYKPAKELNEETGYINVPRFVDSTEKILVTLWEESIYGLKVDDELIRVPDFYTFGVMLAEKEMEPARQKGLTVLSEETVNLLIDKKLAESALVILLKTKFKPRWPVIIRKGEEVEDPDTYPLFVPLIARLMEAFGKQVEDENWSKDGINDPDPRGPQYNRTVLIRDLKLTEPRQRNKLKSKITDPVAWDEVESWLDTFPKVKPGPKPPVPIYKPRARKVLGRVEQQPVVEEEEEQSQPQIERIPTPQTEEQPNNLHEESLQRQLAEEEEEERRSEPQPEPEPEQTSRRKPSSRKGPKRTPRSEPEPEPQPEVQPEPQHEERTTTPLEPPKDVQDNETIVEQEEESQQQAWVPVNARQLRAAARAAEAPVVEQPEPVRRGRKAKAKAEPKPKPAPKPKAEPKSKGRGRPKRTRGAAAASQEEIPETPQQIPVAISQETPIEIPEDEPAKATQEELPVEPQAEQVEALQVEATQVEAPQVEQPEAPQLEQLEEPQDTLVEEPRKEPSEAPREKSVEAPQREPSEVLQHEPMAELPVVPETTLPADESFAVTEDTLQEEVRQVEHMDTSYQLDDSRMVTETPPRQIEPEKEPEMTETQVPATQESPQHTNVPDTPRDATPDTGIEVGEQDVVPNTSQASPEPTQREQTAELHEVEMGEASEIVEPRREESPSHTRFAATPGPNSYESTLESRPDSKSSNEESGWHQPIDLIGFASNNMEKVDIPVANAHDSDVEMEEDLPIDHAETAETMETVEAIETVETVETVEEITTTLESEVTKATITHQEVKEDQFTQIEEVKEVDKEQEEDREEMDIDAASPETVRPETPQYFGAPITESITEQTTSVSPTASRTPPQESNRDISEISEVREPSIPVEAQEPPAKDVSTQMELEFAVPAQPEKIEAETTQVDPTKESAPAPVEQANEQELQQTTVDNEEPATEVTAPAVEQAEDGTPVTKEALNGTAEQERQTETLAPERTTSPPHQTEVEILQLEAKSPQKPVTKKSKIVTLKLSGAKPQLAQLELNAAKQQSLVTVQAPAPTEKKRRGRPPKNAVSGAVSAATPKRSVRPRKILSEQFVRSESPLTVPAPVSTTPLDSSEASPPPLPPPTFSKRGRPLNRAQPVQTPVTSPVKKKVPGRGPGRPPKVPIPEPAKFEPAHTPRKAEPAKPNPTPKTRRRVDEDDESSETSELSLVESSDDDEDFVAEVQEARPKRKAPPPKRELRQRSGNQKSYKEPASFDFDSEEDEEQMEDVEEEVVASQQLASKFKSPEILKTAEQSPSTRTTISSLVRTPSPKPTEERIPTPESEEDVQPTAEEKEMSPERVASPEGVSAPVVRESSIEDKQAAEKAAAAKKQLEDELFGSDSEPEKEAEHPTAVPKSTEQEVETPGIEKSPSPLRNVAHLLGIENDEDEQEEEFKTAEDQHQSERHEEFFTPPEQQLLNEQAMHDSEERQHSHTPDAMKTLEDHHHEEAADTSMADTTMADISMARTPEPVPQTVIHHASVEPAHSPSPVSASPQKLAPLSLDSEIQIPVASPEEIQEFSKVLESEMREKEAVEMDNTIRAALLHQDSEEAHFDIEKLTRSMQDNHHVEDLSTNIGVSNLEERLQSVSEAEEQAAVEAFVAEASKELQGNASLFTPHEEVATGVVSKITGEEEPSAEDSSVEKPSAEELKQASTPTETGQLTEPRVETEVHVDLEIRERFASAAAKEFGQHEQEESQPIHHQTPPAQGEAETPQGFPEHYTREHDIGQEVVEDHQSQEQTHLETRQEEHREIHDSRQSEYSRDQGSEPVAQEEADVTLEPKVEEDSGELQAQGWDAEHNNANEYFGMNHQPQHPPLENNMSHLQPSLQSPTEAAHDPALHLPPMLSPESETAGQPIELPRILPQIQFSQPQNLPPGLPQQLLSSIHPAKRPRLESKSHSHDRESSPVHTSTAAPTETINHVACRIPPQHSPPSHQQQSPLLANGSFTATEPDWTAHTAREQRFVDQSPPFPSPTDAVRRKPAPRHEDTTPRGRPTPREERDRQVMGPPQRLPDRFGPQFTTTPTRQRLAAKLAARVAAGNQQRTPKSAAPQRIGSLEIREVSSDRLEERLQRRLQERMREKMKNKRIKEEPPRKARQEQRMAESLRQRLEQDFDRGSREPSVARVTEPQRRPLHVNRSRGVDSWGRFDDDGFNDYDRDKRRQNFDRRPNGFVNRPADSHREETLRWTQEQRTRIRDEIGHTPINRNRPPVPEWTPESVAQPDFPDFDDRDEPPGKKMRYDYDPVHEDQYRTLGSSSREDSRTVHRLQETHSSVYHTPTQRSQQNHNSSFNSASFSRDFHTMEMNLPWPFPGIIVKRYRVQDPGFQNLQESATQATVPEDEPQLDGEDEIDDADHHSLQSAQVVSPRDIYQQQPDEDSENSGEDDGTDYISQSQQAYLQPPPAQPQKRRRGRPRGTGKLQVGTRGVQEPEYPNDSTPSTRGGGRRGRPPGRPPGSGRGRGRPSKSAAEARDSPPGPVYSTPRRASGQGSFSQSNSQSYYNNSQTNSQSNTRDLKGNIDGSAPKKRGRPRKNFPMKEEGSYYSNGTGRGGEDGRANGGHNDDDPSLS